MTAEEKHVHCSHLISRFISLKISEFIYERLAEKLFLSENCYSFSTVDQKLLIGFEIRFTFYFQPIAVASFMKIVEIDARIL